MSADIDAVFHKLQASGASCDANYSKAEHAIYEVLVKTYIFYQQQRNDPNYLAKKYKADGITWGETGNRVNFRPLVRLIFRLDVKNASAAEKSRQTLTIGSQRNRISDYTNVLEMFDDEWTARPDDFKTGVHGKLMGLIQERSIQSLANARREENRIIKGKNKPEDSAEIEETQQVLATLAMADVKNKTAAIGTVKMGKLSEMNVDADGLAACICRYNAATNSYEILATSSDASAMRTIAVGDSMHIDTISSRALRTISEVVATQSFPSKHIPSGNRQKLTGALASWYKSVYLEQSNKAKKSTKVIKDADGTTKKVQQAVTTNRRLLVRGKTSILLSAQRTDASVVTILRPSQNINPSATDDVSMRSDNLRLVEEWIENGTIAARKSTPADRLGAPIAGTKAKYALTVDNKHAKTAPRYIHFEDIHRAAVRKATLGQVDINTGKFIADWSFSCKRDWLMKLRRECLDEWFEMAASGKKLKRTENSLLELEISKQAFKVGYEIDTVGQNPTSKIALSAPATLKSTAKFMLFAKDVAPILHNLTELTLTSDVKFSGDAAVMLVEFSTELGSYTIAVPTIEQVGTKYKRNSKWFKSYGARS